MSAYKMRAEAMIDVGRAIVELCEQGCIGDLQIMRCDAAFGDVIVSFTFEGPIGQVVKALERVTDGHVMVRTVDLAGFYTGEHKRDENNNGGVK